MMSVKSWETGHVPEDRRRAGAAPLFRKGKQDPGSYRLGASLALVPGKLLEQSLRKATC